MNNTDILLIIGCVVIGYALVSMLLSKPPRPPAAPASRTDAAGGSAPASPVAPPRTGPPHWTTVLELPFDASAEDVRAAYRRLIGQYHPDKVAALGQELRDLAERKSAEITVAYQDALAERRAGG